MAAPCAAALTRISALAGGVGEQQPLESALAGKRAPLTWHLRQPVRHRPPSHGVEPQANVAGVDLYILGMGVVFAGGLHAGLPGDHTVGAGVDGCGGHGRGGGQVEELGFVFYLAPAG